MAKTKIQKEMTGVVENFIGLWNRYYSLYLEGATGQDISSEKENEFLKFQGTMVEQLVKVLEIERGKFDVKDKVMAVINDIVSLDLYSKMSEFQVKRVRQQWQEGMEELEKLYRYCDSYDPKLDKVEKITEVKRKNPFWDPTSGGIRSVIYRLTMAPVTFFQGLKPGVPADKINLFCFLTYFIPSMVVLTILFISNFDTVKIIGRNVCIEAGLIMRADTGALPVLMTSAIILAGMLVIALVISIVMMLLHYIFSILVHFTFRLTGGKEDFNETFKATTYGAAPIMTIIAAPYAIVLQIIGGSKVHKYPYFLSAIGWLLGVAVFFAVLFTAAGSALYFTDMLPPQGEYLYVNEESAQLTNRRGTEQHTLSKGDVFTKYKEPKFTVLRKEVFEVEHKDGKKYFINAEKVTKKTFSWTGLPKFTIEQGANLIGKGRELLGKIIEKYKD